MTYIPRSHESFVAQSAVDDMQRQYSRLRVKYAELENKYNLLLTTSRQMAADLQDVIPAIEQAYEEKVAGLEQMLQMVHEQFDIIFAENMDLRKVNDRLKRKMRSGRKTIDKEDKVWHD